MAFAAGQKVTAAQLNSACPTGHAQTASNNTPGTTTSTSYTSTLTGSTSVTLAFTTPASGSIWVTVEGSAKHSATNGFPALSFAISGAAGTRAASDDYQAFHQSAGTAGSPELMMTRRSLITGLTAGAAGTITLNHKVTVAGTGTFNFRRISYEPVPA